MKIYASRCVGGKPLPILNLLGKYITLYYTVHITCSVLYVQLPVSRTPVCSIIICMQYHIKKHYFNTYNALLIVQCYRPKVMRLNVAALKEGNMHTCTTSLPCNMGSDITFNPGTEKLTD